MSETDYKSAPAEPAVVAYIVIRRTGSIRTEHETFEDAEESRILLDKIEPNDAPFRTCKIVDCHQDTSASLSQTESGSHAEASSWDDDATYEPHPCPTIGVVRLHLQTAMQIDPNMKPDAMRHVRMARAAADAFAATEYQSVDRAPYAWGVDSVFLDETVMSSDPDRVAKWRAAGFKPFPLFRSTEHQSVSHGHPDHPARDAVRRLEADMGKWRTPDSETECKSVARDPDAWLIEHDGISTATCSAKIAKTASRDGGTVRPLYLADDMERRSDDEARRLVAQALARCGADEVGALLQEAIRALDCGSVAGEEIDNG